MGPVKSSSSVGTFKPIVPADSRPKGSPVDGYDASTKPSAAACLPKGNPLLTNRAEYYKGLSESEKSKLYSKLEKLRPEIEAKYGESLGAAAFEHAVARYIEAIEFTQG